LKNSKLETRNSKPSVRIGYGFDSHEFQPGIPLRIGGVTLAHNKGLGGHSDGDLLLHAITDALLGAVAAPDIGALFPPSDPRWKGADSVIFLREALKRVWDGGYDIANLDATLILAAPKIGPHSTGIRVRVAELLGVHRDCVGLKAALAHVVVLLEKRVAAKKPSKSKSKNKKKSNRKK
jgi:2-C-methyl-D-erythritol 2,4-cyclodiphosphate synthase